VSAFDPPGISGSKEIPFPYGRTLNKSEQVRDLGRVKPCGIFALALFEG
jgi:hypothetical protein